eukprot:14960211-Alexandrium_andersonii.AAC.1
MPRPRVPLLKRGARAWEMARKEPSEGRARGGVNRLQIYAVDDETNANYAKAVREFLLHVRYERVPFLTFEQRDRALADYLSDLCYVTDAGLAKGSLVLSGFCHIFPEHKGEMKEAARAMRGWQQLGLSGEGGPLHPATLAAIGLDM